MRGARLAVGYAFDFRENGGGLVFERAFGLFEVLLRVFPGAMLEFHVAQVLINRVTPFEELIEMGAMRRGVCGIGLDVKNKNNRGSRKRETRQQHRPIHRGDSQELRSRER
jgi:hypothetical protein